MQPQSPSPGRRGSHQTGRGANSPDGIRTAALESRPDAGGLAQDHKPFAGAASGRRSTNRPSLTGWPSQPISRPCRLGHGRGYGAPRPTPCPSKRRWPSHKAAPGRGWQMQLRRVRSTTQLLDDFEIVRTRPGIDGDIGHRMELGRPIEVFREHVGLNRSGVEELREQFRKMFPKRHPA